VLVDAVTPLLVKTKDNPEGAPIETFDQIRTSLINDRPQFWKDFAIPFYGANRPGAKISQGILDAFWLMSMQAGFLAAYECVKAFSETDFREDLKKFDVPTLVIHGDDDQIVPFNISGAKSSKMIKGATLKVYKGAPHGLMSTNAAQFNADLLEFAEEEAKVAESATRARRTEARASDVSPPA
jgi:non-heme chloroperoxidase